MQKRVGPNSNAHAAGEFPCTELTATNSNKTPSRDVMRQLVSQYFDSRCKLRLTGFKAVLLGSRLNERKM